MLLEEENLDLEDEGSLSSHPPYLASYLPCSL